MHARDANATFTTIHTDGACLGNPGPGGYGVVIAHRGARRELSAGFRRTTNNRMELLAAIVGLECFDARTAIVLYSDSRYLVDAVEKGWARKWRANRWMRNPREAAVNPDLWERMLALVERHDVSLRWVRGHAGNRENERCDVLATGAARGAQLEIDVGYEQVGVARAAQRELFRD
ncbi:MAG: ribonuclease HI [Planctomycetes bacterium]|nr:ribonuclease HI [Planctomycetota bacterium]